MKREMINQSSTTKSKTRLLLYFLFNDERWTWEMWWDSPTSVSKLGSWRSPASRVRGQGRIGLICCRIKRVPLLFRLSASCTSAALSSFFGGRWVRDEEQRHYFISTLRYLEKFSSIFWKCHFDFWLLEELIVRLLLRSLYPLLVKRFCLLRLLYFVGLEWRLELLGASVRKMRWDELKGLVTFPIEWEVNGESCLRWQVSLFLPRWSSLKWGRDSEPVISTWLNTCYSFLPLLFFIAFISSIQKILLHSYSWYVPPQPIFSKHCILHSQQNVASASVDNSR